MPRPLGDNVLTRINLCMKTPHIVQRMQRAVVRGTLSPLLAEALREAGVDAAAAGVHGRGR